MTYQPYLQFHTRDIFTPSEKILFPKVVSEQLPNGEIDAVIWIEGDADDRVQKTLEVFEFYKQNPMVVLSGGVKGNPYRPDKGENPDGGNIPSWEIEYYFLQAGVSKEKIILERESLNAKDQAVNVIRIARENGWKRIVLVASLWHQMRLFLTFVKQLQLQEALDIELINQPEIGFPLDRKIPGRGKDTFEMIKEDLWRIDTYIENGSIIQPEEGLKYLEKFKKNFIDLSKNIKIVMETIK